MRTVSSRFQTAISGSHRLAISVDVLRGSGVAATIDTVVDGSVTLDITAATRGRVDLTITGDDLIPTSPTDLLAPYGNELQVKRGVRYADGTVELVSLGVFRIDSVEISDAGAGREIRLSGGDRSVRVIDARFEEPYQITAGTNVATAIQNTVADALPSITFDLTSTTMTTPLLSASEGDDRWKFVQDLAASIGHALYFDGDGTLVSRPVANTGATAPATQLTEDTDGLLLSADRSWGRAGTYNRVIATGENTGEGAAVRGVATDLNTSSPTYYYGGFGRVPRFYSSQFITTDDQAADAAAAMLSRELGTTQQINFGTVCNPALEPNDVARVTRAALGIDEDHIIDSLTIPLGSQGAMTGKTRAVTK